MTLSEAANLACRHPPLPLFSESRFVMAAMPPRNDPPKTALWQFVRDHAGEPGSTWRSDFLYRISWRCLGAGLAAIAAGGASGSMKVAIFVAVADIVVRPLLRRWHRIAWRRGTDWSKLNLDGDGI